MSQNINCGPSCFSALQSVNAPTGTWFSISHNNAGHNSKINTVCSLLSRVFHLTFRTGCTQLLLSLVPMSRDLPKTQSYSSKSLLPAPVGLFCKAFEYCERYWQNTHYSLLQLKTSSWAFAYMFILLQENWEQFKCSPLHCVSIILSLLMMRSCT